MKIFDIVKKEKDNSNIVLLHKEGLFWRAYERSAFLFVKYIKEYQVIKNSSFGFHNTKIINMLRSEKLAKLSKKYDLKYI